MTNILIIVIPSIESLATFLTNKQFHAQMSFFMISTIPLGDKFHGTEPTFVFF